MNEMVGQKTGSDKPIGIQETGVEVINGKHTVIVGLERLLEGCID